MIDTRYPEAPAKARRAAVGAAAPTVSLLVTAPEPTWATIRVYGQDDEVRPALLLRVDPEEIREWPGDDRVVSAGEFLRLHGWRIMRDPGAGGINDLFAWGVYVAPTRRGRGHDLVGLRRPGGLMWAGRVPVPADWLSKIAGRKGRLVHCFAVPDSPSVEVPGILADRVRKAANEEKLLGGRAGLREVQA